MVSRGEYAGTTSIVSVRNAFALTPELVGVVVAVTLNCLTPKMKVSAGMMIFMTDESVKLPEGGVKGLTVVSAPTMLPALVPQVTWSLGQVVGVGVQVRNVLTLIVVEVPFIASKLVLLVEIPRVGGLQQGAGGGVGVRCVS